uniref:cytochrome b/b6 domain-containing protein n=1 Tax=Polynucleobacter sp. TaxID=2029855 RepID=UPI004047273F
MKICIWDLPTRLFHWLLVMAVIGSFVSVKLGGNTMIWHGRFGYLVLTLIFFRLIWGFVGTHHARFAHFIRSPKAILAYLKNPVETPGHSPVGAISVLLLIGLFLTQALAGLFASDDIAFDGPLAKYVASNWVELLTSFHRWNEWVLLALVGTHIGTILYYKYTKRINLISAMITGDKEWAETAPLVQDDSTVMIKATAILLAIALIMYYFLR